MKTLRDALLEAVAAMSDEEAESLWNLAGARRLDEESFLEELKENPHRDSFEDKLLKDQEVLVRVVSKLDEAGERWYVAFEEANPQSPPSEIEE